MVAWTPPPGTPSSAMARAIRGYQVRQRLPLGAGACTAECSPVANARATTRRPSGPARSFTAAQRGHRGREQVGDGRLLRHRRRSRGSRVGIAGSPCEERQPPPRAGCADRPATVGGRRPGPVRPTPTHRHGPSARPTRATARRPGAARPDRSPLRRWCRWGGIAAGRLDAAAADC